MNDPPISRRQASIRVIPRGRVVGLACLTLLMCLFLTRGPSHAQNDDDHGNHLNTATPVELNTIVTGALEQPGDVDVFELDLTATDGATDVWVYTGGDLDTVGGVYNSNGRVVIASDDGRIVGRWLGFDLRATLTRGIYYIGVFSSSQQGVGAYTLHVELVDMPGGTLSTASPLPLGVPTPGTIAHRGATNHFLLVLSEPANVVLYARPSGTGRVEGGVVSPDGGLSLLNEYREYGGFRVRHGLPAGRHHIRIEAPADADRYPGLYTVHAYPDLEYDEFLDSCISRTVDEFPDIGDLLYGCQWYLGDETYGGINAEAAWAAGATGQDVNVAVVDDGLDHGHEDLRDNMRAEYNHDYSGTGDVFDRRLHHGTAVAGLIAARDNARGIRGVAPRASIFVHNLLARPNSLNIGDALARNREMTAVSNNSWSPVEGPGLNRADAVWESAIESGIDEGYTGRGTFYSWAAGNGGEVGDYANLDEAASFHGVATVCATDDLGHRSPFSEMGPNLWVCAPGETTGPEPFGIVSTENYDRYRYRIAGTSVSTALVSGVAALIRHANPQLTWRDVKLLLAGSARLNDPTNPGWAQGPARYGAATPEDRYWYNHAYGFGLVDAGAAVQLAREWTLLPEYRMTSVDSGAVELQISDPGDRGLTTLLEHSLQVDAAITFTEFVAVVVDVNHPSVRDLQVDLVSPGGAISRLAPAFDTFTPDDLTDEDYYPLRGRFRFGSARHLGENPNGTWTIRVADRYRGLQGVLNSWQITVYGHQDSQVPMPHVVLAGPAQWKTRINQPVAVAVSFSEPVAGFDLNDVSVAGGHISSLEEQGDGQYIAHVVPTEIDPVVVHVNEGVAVGAESGLPNTRSSDLPLGIPYDDDRDGRISRAEVIQGITDYFAYLLSREHVIRLVQRYFFDV